MNDRNDSVEPKDLRIAEEAAEWLLRIDEDRSDGCHAEFAAWLRHSPQHMEEFLMLSATASAARGIDPQRKIDVEALLVSAARNIVPLQGRVIASPPSLTLPRTTGEGKEWSPPLRGRSGRGRSLRWGLGIAATLSIIAIAWWQLHPGQTYSTAIGELHTVALSDGSKIELNTKSRLRVSYSAQARDIELLEGEALFVVAQDPNRPFRVAAGAARIQAVGTQFNVYRRDAETTVSVVEGRVKIGAAPVLGAGEEVRLDKTGQILKRAETDVAAAVAWRQLRLVFKSERLDVIAAEFNRYNRTAIRVEGPAAARRLTGTFNANEPEGFLRFLERDASLDITKTGTTALVRAR